ncbi:MAG: FAD-binding oxidoreductase [Candidatus Solibacter usitatus]|nr:FAD-binding oxidoreductase [Candidatus Solibacter usitatus]
MNPAYLEDASGFRGHAEQFFAPQDESQVLDVLRRASRDEMPVTLAGAGTGVTGGRVPLGGWVLSLEKLNRLEVRQCTAVAGPAVLLRDLHAAATRSGQFYPPDPTETAASLGGTIATNASGSRSFLYGDTRRHVQRLRVALMDGRLLDVRRGDKIDFEAPALPRPRTTKHTAGYYLAPGMDWVDLFIGSEGTLGVILEAEVSLRPAPAAVLAGVIFFPTAAGWEQLVRVPGLRMIEYFDDKSVAVLRTRYPEIPREAASAVLVEQELSGEDDPEIDRWPDRLDAAGALTDASWFATTARDRERFRTFRHALPEIVNDTVRRRGFMKFSSDHAVPLDRNIEMLDYYRSTLEAGFPGRYVIFGHIGDAHLHVNILPESEDDSARARLLMIEFARHAVALGGTVSAEHGLGKRKAHFLELQFTLSEIESMKQVKRRLDPKWLLGRGTLFQ